MKQILLIEQIDIGLITIAAVAAVLFIALIVVLIVSKLKTTKYEKELEGSIHSLRIYVLDYKNNRVTYFNRAKLDKQKRGRFLSFYSHYPAKQRLGLINWITSLLNGEDVPEYFEVDVRFYRTKKLYRSIMVADKVDRENQLVHLSSILLLNITKYRNLYPKLELNMKSINSLVEQKREGLACVLYFHEIKPTQDDYPSSTIEQFIDVLCPVLNDKRLISRYSQNEIALYFSDITTKMESHSILTKIKQSLDSYLELCGLTDEYGYVTSLGFVQEFKDDFKYTYQTLSNQANIAYKQQEKIIIYDSTHKINKDDDQIVYKTEVERIIANKKIKYSYRPIFSLNDSRVIAYQSFAEPVDSLFNSIDEIKAYAVKTNDDKELFTTISKNIITRFLEENFNSSVRLFFPITAIEKNYLNKVFPHINNIKNAHIVLVISETEVLDMDFDTDADIINDLQTLKSKGYEICLNVDDTQNSLSNATLTQFDYFLFDTNEYFEDKTSNAATATFRQEVENLLKYNKPIIASNIQNWDQIQLLVKLGIRYLSSNVIGKNDENIIPINPKSIIKLRNLLK